MVDRQELEQRFTYHAPDDEKVRLHNGIREFGLQFSLYLDEVLPPGRELSLAQTKIEEAVMWANAGIARRT